MSILWYDIVLTWYPIIKTDNNPIARRGLADLAVCLHWPVPISGPWNHPQFELYNDSGAFEERRSELLGSRLLLWTRTQKASC